MCGIHIPVEGSRCSYPASIAQFIWQVDSSEEMRGDRCQGLDLSFLLQSLHRFYLKKNHTHRLGGIIHILVLCKHLSKHLCHRPYRLFFAYCLCHVLNVQKHGMRHLSLPRRLVGDVGSVPQAVDFTLICLRKWNNTFLRHSVPVTDIQMQTHEALCIHNVHTNIISAIYSYI